MKPSLITLAAIMLLPLCSLAQSNYKPGYIVMPKGDTVKGFIDYQEWDNNPESVNFKKVTDGQSIKYGVNDIAFFSIDRTDSYRSCTVSITTGVTDPNKIEYLRDTSMRTAAVFLRVLEQGTRLALYSYRDDIKIRYYVAEAPAYEPKELIYRVYNDPDYENNQYKKQGDLSPIITENTFQKQLSAEAYKYDELKDNLIALIARSEYIEDDLVKIVRKINHTTKAQYAKMHYSGPSFGIFAGAAVSISTISPSVLSPYWVAGGRAHTSYGQMIAFGANFFANPVTRRLQFRIELSASRNNYRSLYMSKVLPYVPTEALFDVLALSISPQIIYNIYNGNNFKAFIGAGMTYSRFNYTQAYFGSQNHDGSEADIAKIRPFYFNNVDNAFIGKAGVQLKSHFVIYSSIQGKVAFTGGGYFSMSSSYKQFGINYLF